MKMLKLYRDSSLTKTVFYNCVTALDKKRSFPIAEKDRFAISGRIFQCKPRGICK